MSSSAKLSMRSYALTGNFQFQLCYAFPRFLCPNWSCITREADMICLWNLYIMESTGIENNVEYNSFVERESWSEVGLKPNDREG